MELFINKDVPEVKFRMREREVAARRKQGIIPRRNCPAIQYASLFLLLSIFPPTAIKSSHLPGTASKLA